MKRVGLNDPASEFQPAYIPKFENPEQFIEAKLDMLYNHFKIRPTDDEIARLYEKKTECDINLVVKTILNNHWK